MKYLFLTIAFFSLGYVLPTFSPVLQLMIAGMVLLIIALVLYFYVDTMGYASITG